jgi:parvulin-like peptidyl-prolyl isomerase
MAAMTTMTAIVRIDDEVIGIEELVRTLKLTGRFAELIDQLVRDKLTVRAAKKQRIPVSVEEIQQRADQFRSDHGLHRAADTNRYLDAHGVSLDEFEAFISDCVYQEKMMKQVCGDEAVEKYFKLNASKFNGLEVSHMVLDSEGKAKEMISLLRDDPDCFAEMALEHSIADTRERGGLIGKVLRGSLKPEIEAKVFNAAVGDLLGPFASPDRSSFEIFRVNAKRPATLDDETATEVRRLIREGWLAARAQEHVIRAN